MKIHLPNYSQSSHLIEESIEAEELDLDCALFVSMIHARLKLDRHDPYLDFKIVLTSRIHLECDRCLEPFDLDLTAEGPMLFILGPSPDGEDIDDAEISYIPPATHDLDLTPVLRDLLMVAVPTHHLCRNNCQGLCPNCGANLNCEPCFCKSTLPSEL